MEHPFFLFKRNNIEAKTSDPQKVWSRQLFALHCGGLHILTNEGVFILRDCRTADEVLGRTTEYNLKGWRNYDLLKARYYGWLVKSVMCGPGSALNDAAAFKGKILRISFPMRCNSFDCRNVNADADTTHRLVKKNLDSRFLTCLRNVVIGDTFSGTETSLLLYKLRRTFRADSAHKNDSGYFFPYCSGTKRCWIDNDVGIIAAQFKDYR